MYNELYSIYVGGEDYHSLMSTTIIGSLKGPIPAELTAATLTEYSRLGVRSPMVNCRVDDVLYLNLSLPIVLIM